MKSGETLYSGQALTSPNGQYVLEMQSDGNLVEYMSGLANWSTHTFGHPGARAVMQSDGNLVVYSSSNAVLWNAGSGGHPGSWYLNVQDDGNLVIYSQADGASAYLWASFSIPSSLRAGQSLFANQYLTSPNRQFVLLMQSDGNLVQYMHGTATWNTKTYGHPGAHVSMQTDGNLVVYGSAGAVLFNAATSGVGNHFDVQSDGNLVVYSSANSALYNTGTVLSGLHQGQTLTQGNFLTSPNGKYRFILQDDGNLVLYSGATAIWVEGSNAGKHLDMQTDGNLVLYNASNVALWTSGSGGHPTTSTYWFVVQSDRNLVVYQDGSTVLFQSATNIVAAGWGAPPDDGMRPTNTFPTGQCTYGVEEHFNQYVSNHLPDGIRPPAYIDVNGDAWAWADSARSRGWTVDTTPAPNSIVVFEPGVDGANGTYGHVAWVNSVSGSTIYVWEMNIGGLGNVRTNNPYAIVSGTGIHGEPDMQFIHIP